MYRQPYQSDEKVLFSDEPVTDIYGQPLHSVLEHVKEKGRASMRLSSLLPVSHSRVPRLTEQLYLSARCQQLGRGAHLSGCFIQRNALLMA